ncbi:MAG TPA: alpha/beta fold hydrolase [Steroidobacteraceae bacterium]|nr:alpha/beta fold hydrolase [Steroidobacteraceae bacterium]
MTQARLVRPFIAATLLVVAPAALAAGFTVPQILGAPFASDLVASRDARAFAWVSDARGARNVWLAVAASADAAFEARPLTQYTADDGLDIDDLAFVPHHDELLYVRGGDFEYPDKPAPNPAQLTAGVVQEVYLVDFHAHGLLKLGEGHGPVAAPDGEHVLFLHEGKVFTVAPRKGAKAEQLFKTRGIVDSLRFSPDGKRLAFVCTRSDHSFIGVYTFADRTLRWIDASFSYDVEPRWSPNGTRIAFLRIPSTHDEVGLVPHRTGSPWSIRVASLGDAPVAEVYRAPRGAGSVFHALSSEQQLFWAGNDRLVFPAENDGWLHFYSVPTAGGPARLLTPGTFEIEYAAASADGSRIIYAANAGDVGRRHLWQLSTADGRLEQLSRGAGIETQPAVLADGASIAFLRADARTPMHAARLAPGQPIVDLMAEGLPRDFPGASLVEPQLVDLPPRAGLSAHGVLFVPVTGGTAARHPAVVFMHGGPIRQILLGWHYMHYYSNAYAMNQYLASRGYVVLALNYRTGIGYGLDFREAEGSGASGASEYNDLLAAADLLRARGDVDPTRIGLWGGSYGGYLTALGLARNSDLFKAGVDLHGVHDWHHYTLATDRNNLPLYPLDASPAVLATALAASPIGALAGWRSPVLLISGDDDHNVAFSESVRLAEALRERGVDYQELVLPDEIHGFLRHASWVRAYQATSDFLDAKLGGGAAR